jgi:iron complex outermembrane recepter protein
MSLEQLSQTEIRVTSAAKKDQDLWLTLAAVYVITKEDIAQSSATSIPELLRVVPGLQVAQIDASFWAVTARGFNSEYASKLLVLVDGRTVYSEIYSAAHWDQVDLPLEQIERIEVIRGPGAAVWGTNAVNGVVNIISKKIPAQRGNLVSGHVSRIDDAGTVGYSGPLGSRAHYGGYVRYIDREPFEVAGGP